MKEEMKGEVAYFSMEICLEQALPTYSGGLGVLAGDTLRSAADLGVPMVGITLLYRSGYFRQHLDAHGVQTESPVVWKPEELLEPLDTIVTVTIEGREVKIRPWKYIVKGEGGHEVPVYLLDAALPENDPWDRELTGSLYGGDSHYRLCQEVILGMGGASVLRALGYGKEGLLHHINEGHAALLTLCLLERQIDGRGSWEMDESDVDAVRRRCVFTTHTPVPAGHDKFPIDMVRSVLGDERVKLIEAARTGATGELNMTLLAMRLSGYVNGVAMRHAEVSRDMFPGYSDRIASITNGVHAATWVSRPFRDLFDRHIAEWRQDNQYLRNACTIPLAEIADAHRQAKEELLETVLRRTGVRLDPDVLTLGFARRSTPYKRADMIFTEPMRLKRMAKRTGPLQILYAGKAHPRDEPGKALIRRIYEASHALQNGVRIVYLENYDMALGHLITSGCDVWLNTPLRPLEASGTSGMKAAMNGVPSLSILDGWWIEGCVEGVTGWAVGEDEPLPVDPSDDIHELYYKLERVVLPMYYESPRQWREIMRSAISLNGSFFNTQRMVQQYVRNAYRQEGETQSGAGLELVR
jgi:glycogen phosphorylase